MGRPPQIPGRKPQPLKKISQQDPEIAKLFQQGLSAHQNGQLTQAKAVYEQVLIKQPKHFDALHLLGVICKQMGNVALAEDLIAKAIAVNPNVAAAYSNRGNALKDLKRLEEALASYDKAIALKPDYAEAFYNRAMVLKDLKRPDHALASYDKAIALKLSGADAFNNRGIVLKELHRIEEALASYNKAITLKPDYADAFYNRGNALKDLQRLDEALDSYDKAIACKLDRAEAFNNRGAVLNELQRLDEALASYDKAIALKPDYADAFNNRGNVLQELRRPDQALANYNKAIALRPGGTNAFYNRGNALKDLQRLDEALASYDKAIALEPHYADAFYNRGVVLKDLGRVDEALASYDEAIAIKPDYADALNNRGNALQDLQRLDDALASYDKAIELTPDYADAFYNRGLVLRDLHRLDEALASYDKTVAIEPAYAAAYYNRGNALQEIKRLEDALASYDQAIAIKPDYADALNNRGLVLQDLKRLDEALASYEKALAIKPDCEFLPGTKLHAQAHLCDWRDLSGQLDKLEAGLADGQKVTPPFPMLVLTDEPALQLKASKIYADARHPAATIPADFKKRDSADKIRVGYYSADFHNHATSYLMAELFEAHDSQRFELYGFSFGPDKQDEMRKRVAEGFDEFFDVTRKSDREIARVSRDLGIDIAVDLKGFTQDSRTGIFAAQCAPIQVNYLGYPGTMAAPYFDYIVADKILIPPESQQYYSEKIVYLPHSYQVNDSRRKISDKVFTRQELGLPENDFVFCCFNNNYKILPATMDGWMRLLKAVKASVLWLLEDNPTAARNLRREAQIRGVDPARLVFARRMKLEDHLARHKLADLFVDTLPCNAHTTTSDALWAGLPVLTRMGKSFASRVAASLLHAIDLPELITNTQEDYETRAIELASHPELLKAIQEKLRSKRLTSPLFDGQLFARHLETAYLAMHEKYLSGQAPSHIHVQP